MNKEQQDLLDKVYEAYKTIHKHDIRTEGDRNQLAIESLEKQLIYPQEEFINKIKTNPEFSETWGLKIEERELSLEERIEILRKVEDSIWLNTGLVVGVIEPMLEEHNIPTKLITLTYNNETIESYE
jgi:hypothetical protein